MKAPLYVAILLALPAIAFAPGAFAQVGAGASGQCYDGNATNGGQAEARVDTEDGLILDLAPLPGQGGITDALAMFALGTIQDGGNPGSACDRYDCFASQTTCEASGQDARFDYVAVDVRAEGIGLQVCYRGSASIAGDCPRHPSGAGQ